MGSTIEVILRKAPTDYVSYTDLCHLLPGTNDARYGQIKRALKQGYLINLRKGLYYRGDYLQQNKPHTFEMAQRLYWPSYVSLESALSYYGLIPEAVYTTTSVSYKRSVQFKNSFGLFSYEKGAGQNFFLGVNRVIENECVFLIAEPWKAITDYLFCYKKDFSTLEALASSLRLDLDMLVKIEHDFAHDLIRSYQSKRIEKFLENVLRDYDGSGYYSKTIK